MPDTGTSEVVANAITTAFIKSNGNATTGRLEGNDITVLDSNNSNRSVGAAQQYQLLNDLNTDLLSAVGSGAG